MNRNADTSKPKELAPVPSERLGARRLQRVADIFLAAPAVVVMVIAGFFFWLWQEEDALVRLAHMVWVLGFWMAGTMAMIILFGTARRRPFVSLFVSALASCAIMTAVIFTPLGRFKSVLPFMGGLTLPGGIGFFNLAVSWFVVHHFRKIL